MGLTDAGIKWPNDILVNGRKVVGILTEMSGSMEEISHIVMGIGVNVKTKQEELPEELKLIATSLAMEGIDIERTEAFRIILEAIRTSNIMKFSIVALRKLSMNGGNYLLLSVKKLKCAPGNTYEGVATDIDEDGNLLVRIPDGTVKRIVAGDVSIRPRK